MFSKKVISMKIIKEYENIKLNNESKLLGYCYKVNIGNSAEYYYEIVKKDNAANKIIG